MGVDLLIPLFLSLNVLIPLSNFYPLSIKMILQWLHVIALWISYVEFSLFLDLLQKSLCSNLFRKTYCESWEWSQYSFVWFNLSYIHCSCDMRSNLQWYGAIGIDLNNSVRFIELFLKVLRGHVSITLQVLWHTNCSQFSFCCAFWCCCWFVVVCTLW